MHTQKQSASRILEHILHEISDTAQLKAGTEGLYSNSQKPRGFLSSVIKAFSFFARLLPGGNATAFREANTKIQKEIEEQFGTEAGKSFEAQFGSRRLFGQPITAGRIREFSFGLLKDPKIKLNATARQTILVAKYGATMISQFEESFSKGTVSGGTSEDIQQTFTTAPPAEKETITMLSHDIKSRGELGFYVDSDNGIPDALLPTGGAVIIHGEKARAFMTTQITKSSSFKNRSSSLEEQAEKVDWDRKKITFNNQPLRLKTKGEEGYIAHNLEALKMALKAPSGSPPSDNELYDLLHFISKENTSSGYPSGADAETGICFFEDFVMGETPPPTIEISLAEKGKIRLVYTSPPALLGGFRTPGQADAHLTKDAEGNDLDRNGAHQDLPQFEVATKYTYEYTPPADRSTYGTVVIVDSRQAYWPAPKTAT